MGSAVVKPLARRRGKIKQNKVAVDPANNNEEENATSNCESSMNCKVNPLADSAKNIRQPFGKPCKVGDENTQSNRKVCCTYIFSGKAKSYDSDEELSQVQLVRKKNVSPSQTKNSKQNGTHLSENVQKVHKACLAPKCADILSQSQFIPGDSGEHLLHSQVAQPSGCANVTPVCSEVNVMLNGEAQSMQMCNAKTKAQLHEKLFAAQEDSLRIRHDGTPENLSLRDQDVSCEDRVQSPEYDYLEEVKVINTNLSVREPYAFSSPLQSCGQSSETKMTPTASSVGVSCSKTKHSLELPSQPRLDVGDQIFIKPSPSVEYTKSQCQGAGESLSPLLNYTHNICLISSEVQKRCFQTLCQDFDLKKLKDSNSDYRCSSLCTKSPRVEGNKSVNATNLTVKSVADEALECNENNAIHSTDSFGDVIKRSLLPGFAHSSSTSLNGKGKVIKCYKGSDSSSLNHPHVEDVLAMGEEFVDEIEEGFLQQNSSQFQCMEMGKRTTPVKEKDARLHTSSTPHGTQASPRSLCSSKHCEMNPGWRRSRPGSSVKASVRSSESALAHGSTSKPNTSPCPTGKEIQPDIFSPVASNHRLSHTRQTFMNSELEYGPGYIDDVLSKRSSIPSRACSSRESLHSTKAGLMQSIVSNENIQKERCVLSTVCSSKESLHSTKAVMSQSISDNDMHNIGEVPSVACSPNSFLHNGDVTLTKSTSNKEVMPGDSKLLTKVCSSNESLSNQRAAPTQSVTDKEVTNRGSRAPSRICSSKDSLHSTKAVLSRHFTCNEIMLKDSRASSRACSSKSSLKSTKLVLIPSTLNTAEIPKGSAIIPKACSCSESLHSNTAVHSESISSNEIVPKDKGVPSTTCSSKASLHSARLNMTPIKSEISKDCREQPRQCSSNEFVRSFGATHIALPQNIMHNESMNLPRSCSSKESVQSVGVIETQLTLLTCTETQNCSSKRSSPRAPIDMTEVNIVPAQLNSRPPSSKRSSSSSEHSQGHSRPTSNKQPTTMSDFVQMDVRPHSHHSRISSNASRPSSSLGRRVQLDLQDLQAFVEGGELFNGTSGITRNQKGSPSLHEAASFCDDSHRLNVKSSSGSGMRSLHISPAPKNDISRSEVTDKSPSNIRGSRSIQNSELPADAGEEASSFAHYCIPSTFTTLNQAAKSLSRSSTSSKIGANDEPEEMSQENLETLKATISPCSSSICPPADSTTIEPTNGQRPEKAENGLAIDENSSAALAAAQPYCLSPDKIGNIRRQLYEEGFKPAEREGGVAFFIPVTEDGLQPQADGAVVAERLTKTKKASLNYEERMFLANINRQVQLSKRKEFAVRDIRNVKGATSSSDGSDRTKQTDDVDEFDVTF